MEKTHLIVELVRGCEGDCLLLNEDRVAGPKPWGGGRVVQSWRLDRRQAEEIVKICNRFLGNGPANKIIYEERAKIYTAAREAFGDMNQLMKALEELTEVKLELHRTLDGRGDLLHLAEEVADATIMLEQIRQIFGINEEVCEAMDAKVLRLQQRIEEAKTKHCGMWTPQNLLEKYKIMPKEE